MADDHVGPQETRAMLSLSSLKARGWTEALVTHVLGEPDVTTSTSSGACRRLYSTARVLAAERDPRWRHAAAERVLPACWSSPPHPPADAVGDGEPLQVTVERLPLEEVMERAIAAYNGRKQQFATAVDWEPASMSSSPGFLRRIIVNYIRHALTTYEGQLQQLGGRAEALELRRQMYRAIAEAYPEYAWECERQMRVRTSRTDGAEEA